MKRIYVILVLINISALLINCNKIQDSQYNWEPDAYELIEIQKAGIKVVDGDTIEYRKEKIRFMSIDTPEKASDVFKDGASQEPWATKASDFTKDFIQKGSKIQIIRTENRDRYGRILAYVIVDGKNLSAELAHAGLGYTYYADRYMEQGLHEYRKQVKDAGKNVTPEFEAPDKWRKKHKK